MKQKVFLVTGGAGFIGFHVIKNLLDLDYFVISVDNFNDYYDVNLKKDRINNLISRKNFKSFNVDICNYQNLKEIFKQFRIDSVINLAAQAGVRYSINNPFIYEHYNNLGFLNVLELMKEFNIKKLVFASSSSVYGGNTKIPFSENDRTDKPISIYAATKRTNELYAYVYHHLYNIKCIGLRFFTVYGSWGRPDMATMLFTKAILSGEEIKVFNYGKMMRDFTHISDIVKGIIGAIENPLDYEIINLGNNTPIHLIKFIHILEDIIGIKAKMKMLPIQQGDLEKTFADINKAKKLLKYFPTTSLEEGLREFYAWYKKYYSILE